MNVEADALSRTISTASEWMLNVNIFETVVSHFRYVPDIDLFASRINKQIGQFVSYVPDPEAVHVNAFTLDWSEQKIYCFPPFAIIGKVIRKIINDGAEGILITPDWQTQYWYPLIFHITCLQPFFISPSPFQLSLPNDPSSRHPLASKLALMAWKVSGKL